MASELPKYNDKIEMMHALAPIAFLSNTASPPIRALAPFVTVLSVRIQIKFIYLILTYFICYIVFDRIHTTGVVDLTFFFHFN